MRPDQRSDEDLQTFSVKLPRATIRRGRNLALERGTSLQRVVEKAVADFVGQADDPVEQVLATAHA